MLCSKMAAGEESMEDRDFRVLMEYAHGFMISQVVFAACELGVFDAVAGPCGADAGTVARVVGSSPEATRLLLDTCTALGLLQADAAGAYSNTRIASSLLVTGSPRSQRHMMLYLAGTTYHCWGQLARAVREGRSQYESAVGVATEEPFEAIYRSEAERLLFMRALQETWSICGARALTAFDLSNFRVICDVGGGSGALAREFARIYPDSNITVFDTPEVVAAAQTHFLSPTGSRPSIQFCGGDFFRCRLPCAHLYILARILHDWTDEACIELLGRVCLAGGPGSAVLLVEATLAEDARGPLPTLLLSLNMTVQTRGRERTQAQYRAMAAAAGFSTLPGDRCGDGGRGRVGALCDHARMEVTSHTNNMHPAGEGTEIDITHIGMDEHDIVRPPPPHPHPQEWLQ
ncbi:acetylserotonin O-methyltransferase-like [Acomys russatus]|uniref:acetylserotonin O-methyltransferase-like n=1 Tax=Acomys russatus TaxID=60746 RepID=UPI0021E203DB|nr:acetylserotonin O-methyltransferase-like [Acomys russatus]